VSEPPVVGVGPWTGPPPEDDRLDPELLAHGDRRNVVDRYRYWRHDAIVADLDTHRHPLHVAVENWGHDFNIGSVGIPLVGVDNVTGSVPIETYAFPRGCVLVFGQEGPGLTDEMRAACAVLVHITQYGSTRSLNAGAAAAVAMYAWAAQHAR
jgi:tRNA G18 (ribose-2'-O)-methylase SpoU